MKVLYFSDNTSDHNRRFLEKLSQAGLDVWFLDPTSDRLAQNWLPPGVHWSRSRQIVPRDSDPSVFAGFLPEFQDCLQAIRPDLVHAGPTHNCGYVTALSNFHPWLLTSWGSDVLYQADQGPAWKQATQHALSSADGFLFDCDAVRAKAKQLALVPDSRIVQFPWGIRKGSFTPEGPLLEEEVFTPEPGTCVLVSTRSWEPLYGIDVLLEAFRRAHRVDSLLQLLLLGDGSQAVQVREFIATHGLERAVRTPGQIVKRDMPKWFRVADVYVSCAKSDGTSVSLLEAMATGLPAVVTDIPSNREWIVNAENGWLASPCSAEEFAEQFLQAARLGAGQKRLISQRNRLIVEQRADWDRNFPRLVEMYEQLTAYAATTGRNQG
ncbi:MAG TPA: glycosyltransferase family 4 protein [Candidatus Sulfotelmatobacter sp.]